MASNKTYNRQQQIAARPRDKQIVRMRQAGDEWLRIALVFGVTRQRVQQMYKREMDRRSGAQRTKDQDVNANH